MQVTIHKAKTKFSRVIEAAQAGEDVVIARGDQPIARLVPIRQSRIKFDLLKGKVSGPLPDFFEPREPDRVSPTREP